MTMGEHKRAIDWLNDQTEEDKPLSVEDREQIVGFGYSAFIGYLRKPIGDEEGKRMKAISDGCMELLQYWAREKEA